MTDTQRFAIVMGLMTLGAAIGVYWSVPPAMVFAIFPAFAAGIVAGWRP
jgi:hypothetical protein